MPGPCGLQHQLHAEGHPRHPPLHGGQAQGRCHQHEQLLSHGRAPSLCVLCLKGLRDAVVSRHGDGVQRQGGDRHVRLPLLRGVQHEQDQAGKLDHANPQGLCCVSPVCQGKLKKQTYLSFSIFFLGVAPLAFGLMTSCTLGSSQSAPWPPSSPSRCSRLSGPRPTRRRRKPTARRRRSNEKLSAPFAFMYGLVSVLYCFYY